VELDAAGWTSTSDMDSNRGGSSTSKHGTYTPAGRVVYSGLTDVAVNNEENGNALQSGLRSLLMMMTENARVLLATNRL